jgi:hypothetical protein
VSNINPDQLTTDAISHWDELWNVWRAEPGKWTVRIGRDAQTFYGAETFEVGKDISWIKRMHRTSATRFLVTDVTAGLVDPNDCYCSFGFGCGFGRSYLAVVVRRI